MATGIARQVHWSWSDGHVCGEGEGSSLLALEPEIMTGWNPAVR